MSKKAYAKPVAEMLEFEYANTVTASVIPEEGGVNPAQCTGTNPGHGCLDGGSNPGHGCSVSNDAPGNCSVDHERKQPHQCVG